MVWDPGRWRLRPMRSLAADCSSPSSPYGAPAPPRVASLVGGCLALILGGVATRHAYGASFAHPALAPAIGIGIASGLLWPRRRLPGAPAALALAYLAGIIRTIALGTPALSRG